MEKMKRMPIIAANWKMNMTDSDSEQFILELKKRVKALKDREIILCVPFVSLNTASKAVIGSKIKISSQNLFYEDSGAYTGEVSPLMLKDFCEYALIGHSERRLIFGETDKIINKKVIKALMHNFKVIFCIGETLDERNERKTNYVLNMQLEKGFANIKAAQLKNIIIAYEPVWAIGTGKTATPQIAEEAHLFIRKKIAGMYNSKLAESIPIIYGGSVKSDNMAELMLMKDIDGALVGGASLDINSFEKIVKFDV